MKDQFVPYELALKLKELGFDEPCISHWEIGIDGGGWYLFSSGQWLKCKDLISEYKDSEGNTCGEFLAPLWQQAFDYLLYKLDYKYTITQDGNCFSLYTYYGVDIINDESRQTLLENLIQLCQK